jgi:CubicO group peptidase (beta-lactamase class C family)
VLTFVWQQTVSYEELVKEFILDPLNMTTATFATPPKPYTTAAVGFTPANEPGLDQHQDTWGAPYGALLASATDIAKWMGFLNQRDSLDSNSGIIHEIFAVLSCPR